MKQDKTHREQYQEDIVKRGVKRFKMTKTKDKPKEKAVEYLKRNQKKLENNSIYYTNIYESPIILKAIDIALAQKDKEIQKREHMIKELDNLVDEYKKEKMTIKELTEIIYDACNSWDYNPMTKEFANELARCILKRN